MSERLSKQRKAMRDAWSELLAHGQDVKAVRISTVGDLFLLTEADVASLPSANENADLVSLAGKKALPGA